MPLADCWGVNSDLIFSLSGAISSLQLILHAFGLGKGVGRRRRREGLDRFAQHSLSLDQKLKKSEQVRFLTPFLAIMCSPIGRYNT